MSLFNEAAADSLAVSILVDARRDRVRSDFAHEEQLMSRPFPGMDPYLEGELWTTFHIQLAVEIARQLTPKLLPRYFAFAKQGLAENPLKRTTVMPSPIAHSWVEIRDRSERELVTLIEILSPTNQRGDGRSEYLKQRTKILMSAAHLLEIDLLRTGERVPMTKPLPTADYFVFSTRANRRPESDVWPIALSSPLPAVGIPLREPDPDVVLDLQQAFTTIYDSSPYPVAIDYSKSPDVPLSTAAASWARPNESSPCKTESANYPG